MRRIDLLTNVRNIQYLSTVDIPFRVNDYVVYAMLVAKDASCTLKQTFDNRKYGT